MPGLSLELPPIPLVIDLGILASLGISLLLARRWGETPAQFLNAASIALLGGVCGGWLGAILLQGDYFGRADIATLVFGGGWAWQGAMIGGTLALLLYSQANGVSFWKLADVLAPGLALGQAVGWLGCLNSGCGTGIPAIGPLSWWLPDAYRIYAYRLPTPLFFTALFLLILLILTARRPAIPGLTFAWYLLLSSLGLFFLEFLRGDATLYLGILRISQLLEMIAAALALGLLYLQKSRRRLSQAHA